MAPLLAGDARCWEPWRARVVEAAGKNGFVSFLAVVGVASLFCFFLAPEHVCVVLFTEAVSVPRTYSRVCLQI